MDTGKPYPKLEVGSMNGKGPDLEKLQNDKSYLKDTFPEMAYFEWCRIVQKSTNVVRPTEIDHPDSKQKRNTESTSVKEVQGTQVSQTKVAAKKEDDDGEEKSLEEYLLGGESRKKRLEGIDAMGLAITSKPIQIETPKPKVAVLPSGLAGATSFKVRFDLCEGSGDPIGTIVVEVTRI